MKKFLFYIAIISFGTLIFSPNQQIKQYRSNTIKIVQPEKVVADSIPVPVKKWQVANSPRPLIGTDNINLALDYYQNMGMSKQGAAYLVGDFLQEKPSAFIDGNPCGGVLGDGGLANGFAQWHPDRRFDMPCQFDAQLNWAVNIEMMRDMPSLKTALFDPNSSPATIQYLIQRWERYSFEGDRFYYGANILNQISS